MRLQKLREAMDKSTKGTYTAVKFSEDTIKRIKAFVDKHNIPDPLPSKSYHTTITYSRKYLPDLKALGKLDPPWKGKVTELEIFKSKEDNNCLVVLFDCKKATDRHNQIMDEHDAQYDFDKYNCHFTLSYNCGDFDIKSIPNISKEFGEIEIIEEYLEDLNLDWAKKKTAE
jgi:hypothetical protein